MMIDAVVSLVFVTVAALLGVLGVRRIRKAQRADQEKGERDRRAAIARAVAAGTHLETGHRVCTHPRCKLAATAHGFRIVRDEGAWDTVRRSFGAPARYRVETMVWGESVYCESHSHVARQEVFLFLSQHEQARTAFLRDFEVNVSDFERVGLSERLSALQSEREREIEIAAKRGRRKSNVVSLPTQRTGTGSQ